MTMKITLGNLYVLAKRLQAAAHEHASNVELSPPLTPGESTVIEFLIKQDSSVSIRQIVAATNLAQSWVSTTVKNLQQRGWVVTRPDKRDRRVTTVALIDQVKKEAAEALDINAEIAIEDILRSATAEEMNEVKRGLDTFYEVMKRQGESTKPL